MEGMPQLHIACYQFNKVLSLRLERISKHFIHTRVDPTDYLSSWYVWLLVAAFFFFFFFGLWCYSSFAYISFFFLLSSSSFLLPPSSSFFGHLGHLLGTQVFIPVYCHSKYKWFNIIRNISLLFRYWIHSTHFHISWDACLKRGMCMLSVFAW